MAQQVRSAVSFQVDAADEATAAEKVEAALKKAGFKLEAITGVSRLIDYIRGDFLVHADLIHDKQDNVSLEGQGKQIHQDLIDAGLAPRSQPGLGLLAPGDSRLESATPETNSLLNDTDNNSDRAAILDGAKEENPDEQPDTLAQGPNDSLASTSSKPSQSGATGSES